MFKLIHYNRCSKSRECKKILDGKKIKYELIEYSKNKLNKNLITEIVSNINQISRMIRTNEKKFKINTFNTNNKKQLIDFLFEHQNCIQRPIFFDGKKYHICRPPKKVIELL